MKAPTLKVLEVAATLRFVRPLPYYRLGADQEVSIRAFVDGECPVESELRALDSFRQAVAKLVREALTHPAGCEDSEPPFVALTLAGGECHQDPDTEFCVSLGYQRWDDVDLWVVRWTTDEGQSMHATAGTLEPLLTLLAHLVDKKTGEWTSRVSFGP